MTLFLGERVGIQAILQLLLLLAERVELQVQPVQVLAVLGSQLMELLRQVVNDTLWMGVVGDDEGMTPSVWGVVVGVGSVLRCVDGG